MWLSAFKRVLIAPEDGVLMHTYRRGDVLKHRPSAGLIHPSTERYGALTLPLPPHLSKVSWCLTPVILASQEVEIRRILVESQPGQIVQKTQS
jgi:hypothetical protein